MASRSTLEQSRRHANLALAAALSICALLVAVLYRFPPDRSTFYPPCPIHQFTGLLCPGCGATRALAALVHLHLMEAFDLNGLLVIAVPFAAMYAAIAYRRMLRGHALPKPPARFIYASLVVTFIFTIARNFA